MNKLWFSILNVFCALSLMASAFLSWQYLTIGTAYIRADYSVFYRTIHTTDPVYGTYYFFYVPKKDFDFKKLPAIHSDPYPSVNFNTPTMNFCLKGLLNLSKNLRTNTLVWTMTSLIFLMISTYFLMNYFIDNKKIAYRYFLPSVFLVWLSFPSLYAQVGGQVSYLILPFLSLAFFLGYLKKWDAMAMALAFVASLKIFFLLFFVWFLIRREWRSSIIFMLSFIFFFFAPLAFFSWHDYQAFFQIAKDQQMFIDHSALSMNGALFGFMLNIIYFFKVKITAIQLNAIVVALSCYIIYRYVVYYHFYLRYLKSYVYELSFSFIVVLSILLSPLAWIYYYVFLLIPAVTLLKINRHYHFSKIFFCFFIAALCLPILAWTPPSHFLCDIIRRFSAFFDLLCWLVCLHLASQAIIHGKMSTGKTQKASYILLAINVALGISLLSVNYAFPFYLTISKKGYLENNDPGVWVTPEKKIKNKAY